MAGFLDPLVNGIGGIASGISGTHNPGTPTIAPLDPGTQNLINGMQTKALAPNSTYSGILNAGTDHAGQIAPSELQAQQQASSQGGNASIGAIRQAYSQNANKGIMALHQQNDMQGQMMKADYMNQVGKVLLQQQVTSANQFQILSNAYNQQEAARAGMVNSLFQVADQGIGMYGARANNPGKATPDSLTHTSLGGMPSVDMPDMDLNNYSNRTGSY